MLQNSSIIIIGANRIFQVTVSGANSEVNTMYGVGKYRYDTNINLAATQMGLVKPGETKTLYVKSIRNPIYEGGRYNGIETKEGTFATNTINVYGYVFIDEEGNEILEPKDVSYATLSGYNVYKNGIYQFVNDGDSIVSINTAQKTTSNSYIEIDLSNYSNKDSFRIVLNAETSCASGNYGFAHITTDKAQTVYNNSTGRLFYLSGTVTARNYETIIPGGQKYYLHVGFYKYNSTLAGENRVKIHSLSVTQLDEPKVEITSDNEPIEYDGKLWYDYGALLKVDYKSEDSTYVQTNTSMNYISIYDEMAKKNKVSQYATSGIYSTYLYNTSRVTVKYSNYQPNIINTVNIMPYENMQSEYRDKIGEIYPVRVRGNKNASNLYGSVIYNTSSNLSLAATHMGLVAENEEKILYIKIVKYPEEGYKSTTRNGITSNYLRTTENGFIFVDKDGNELTGAVINSVTNVQNENSIDITVNAVGQNGANIKEYYYSIDDGEYVKTTNNTYNFTDVEPYRTHTIKVYVKDNNELISDTQSLVLSTTRNINMPEIQIESDVEPVIYNGEEWYPYGTNVTIKYADNMNNLTGHYKYIDERNQVQSTWTDTTDVSTTIPLYHSVTYIAKISDTLGRETEEVNKKINIMPEANGEIATTYYTSYTDNIYPVRVTGTTEGTVYGTDTYLNTSNISKAATHMGLVNIDETNVVYVKIVKSPKGGYIGKGRNNITTSTISSKTDINGFIFVTENGEEIKNPEINSIVSTSGDNEITITIDAESYNGAIEKYYYSIDYGEYIESTSNIYTFNNITNSVGHTIIVYVEDSNKKQSVEYAIYAYINAPIPKFIFGSQPTVYNGENWYPYNTRMTIVYSDNIKSYTGYYRSAKASSKTMSNWSTVSNTGYGVNLTESMIYEAYTYINGLGEGEHLKETINIMLNSNSLQGNVYVSGEIYPVKVTGTTSGNIYGTGTYEYRSSINKAAMHAGLVKNGETKVVYIKVVPCPEGGYIGSSQNGTSSSNLSTANIGFTFVQ